MSSSGNQPLTMVCYAWVTCLHGEPEGGQSEGSNIERMKMEGFPEGKLKCS